MAIVFKVFICFFLSLCLSVVGNWVVRIFAERGFFYHQFFFKKDLFEDVSAKNFPTLIFFLRLLPL